MEKYKIVFVENGKLAAIEAAGEYVEDVIDGWRYLHPNAYLLGIYAEA